MNELNEETKQLREGFKIICRKCGSEDVVFNFEPGTDWGGMTGRDADTIQMGCNACKQNDVHLYV